MIFPSLSTQILPKKTGANFALAYLAIFLVGILTACSQPPETKHEQTDTPQTQTTDDQHQMVQIDTVHGLVKLPINPHPVVVYDMTLMQDLSALGVAVDGLPDKLLLDNFKAKDTPPSIVVGTLFEPDFEVLNTMQPKAILIGARMSSKYDALNQLAPTLDLSIDTLDAYQSSKQRLADLGKLFDKTDKANQLQQEIDTAIDNAKKATQGKGNGLIILVNGNKISAFGKDSRFGFLHTVFGIPMADNNIKKAQHGQAVSFEYLQQINPDWLFVLDRDLAVGQKGLGAKTVLDNPLVRQTKAWKNNHIVYLSSDSYLAYGGYYQWIADANAITEAFSKEK